MTNMQFTGTPLAFAFVLGMAAAASAQVYPSRPVTLIVPFPAGGGVDAMARITAERLTAAFGQQVVIDNRGGAAGVIGTRAAATAIPDGYTLVMSTSGTTSINPSLYARIPYDPIRDFSPLTLTATSPYVVAVHPSLPARSVGELIALVRANPGKYSYASAGLGTPGHLAGELFRSPLGLDLVHVPFSGGPPAINATIAGHTPVSFTALPTAAPQVKDGKLRALAVMSSKRAAALPDVPTMAEAGIPDCEVDIVAGMVVRSETPDDIAQRLHGEIVKALAQPEIRERLSALGFEPVASTRDQFAAWIKAEIPRWRRVIHGVNIPKVE